MWSDIHSDKKKLWENCVSVTGCETCWYMAIIIAVFTKCCRELAKFCRVWPTRVAGCETCLATWPLVKLIAPSTEAHAGSLHGIRTFLAN
jgi:hypothetical protein